MVMLDDDMEGVYFWNEQEKVLIDGSDELMEFCEMMARMCEDAGLKAWGVNCVQDKGAYREYTPFCFTRYVSATFCGHLKGALMYDEEFSLKEDYDYTLMNVWKFGGILRYNKVHYDVKHLDQAGGCTSYRNALKEADQFKRLQKKWGMDVVERDGMSKRQDDFNPILKIPIKGV